MTILYPVVRGVIYVALLLAIGVRIAAAVIAGVHRGAHDDWHPAADSRLSRLQWHLGWILPLAVAIRGACQVVTFAGSDIPITGDVMHAALLEGGWGHAWTLQLVSATLLAAVVLAGFRRWRWLPLVLLAAVVWGQTGMGHAAEHLWPGVSGRVVDATHLLGAGLWLGTLGALAVAVLPVLRGHAHMPALYGTIRRFSVLAQVGVALIVLSGVIAAWRYAGSVGALVHSTWGRLLLLKVACLGGVLAVGWWNWRVVTPSLGEALAAAPARLRRSVRTELLLGLLLLAVTTLLVVSPLPGSP